MTTAIPFTRSRSSVADTTPVWRVGVLASLAGAVVTEAFSLVARALDVPMRAADPGAAAAKDIPVGGFAMAVLMWAAVGVVLAVVLARTSSHAARTFVTTTVAFTLLSLLGPVFATHTETATKVTLFTAHLVAAAIIIPPLAARLSSVRR